LADLLDNGAAWGKFKEWIIAQGGSQEQLDNPNLLPIAPIVETVPAPCGGYIAGIDAAEVGKTCVAMGGGREKKGDPIDYSVGIVHHAKVGDQLKAGNPLLTLHANSAESLSAARERLLAAITWSDEPVSPPPHTLKIIG